MGTRRRAVYVIYTYTPFVFTRSVSQKLWKSLAGHLWSCMIHSALYKAIPPSSSSPHTRDYLERTLGTPNIDRQCHWGCLPRYYFRYRGLVRYSYLVFDVWEDGEEEEESDNGSGL